MNLTELRLDGYGNGVGDIGPLAKLTNLTVLSLMSNQIGDIGALAQLRKLDSFAAWVQSNPGRHAARADGIPCDVVAGP